MRIAVFTAKANSKAGFYNVGEYPGAVADDSSPAYVYGSIFSLKNPAEALAYLDDYEGFGEEQEQPNLFVREVITIEADSGLLICWVYLYNLPFEGLRLIESGDYLGYKNR